MKSSFGFRILRSPMKKTLIITALLVLSGSRIFAQHVLGEIKLVNTSTEYNVLTHNDSILFSYKDVKAFDHKTVNLWVYNGKITESAGFDDLAAVVNEQGLTYYTIKARRSKYTVHSHRMAKEETSYTMSGRLIAYFTAPDFHTVITNAEESTIKIFRWLAGAAIDSSVYQLPFPLKPFTKRQPQFYAFDHSVNSYRGQNDVKIFRSGKRGLAVTVDERGQGVGASHFIFFSGPEEAPAYKRLFVNTKSASTFYCDGKFFRTFADNISAHIEVYDSAFNMLQSDVLTDKLADFTVHELRGLRLRNDAKLKNIMRSTVWGAVGFISVNKRDSSYLIQSGTQEFVKAGPMIVTGPDVIISLVATAVGSAMTLSQEPTSTLRYFFHEWRTNGSLYNLQVKDKSPRQKVDEYELQLPEKEVEKIQSKLYTSYKGGILATYIYKRPAKARILYFE
jgi:hypothetical protein